MRPRNMNGAKGIRSLRALLSMIRRVIAQQPAISNEMRLIKIK
jgi:hypothetical protein